MPKFHKDGWRFIAASQKCTTSTLSKVLSDVLKLVCNTLRLKDNELIRTTGIRRYFVVEGHGEVAQFLSGWNRTVSNVFKQKSTERCGFVAIDFSTMYTAIPHDMLATATREVVKEAFEWQAKQMEVQEAQLGIKWSQYDCSWVRCVRTSHHKTGHTLTRTGLCDLVAWLVNNTFLVNGGVLRRQCLGMPMGTNCAPSLVNLFLYAYEAAFISRLMLDSLESARLFHITFRLIDDVLSVDNPLWRNAINRPSEEGGIYPRALVWSETTVTANEAEFVGMRLVAADKRFHLSVYDKRDVFPFEVRRYPLMKSMIPSTIPYGVCTGLLHRGYEICSGVNDLITFAVSRIQCLVRNGCSPCKLRQRFKSFVIKNVRKYPHCSYYNICRQFESNLKLALDV